MLTALATQGANYIAQDLRCDTLREKESKIELVSALQTQHASAILTAVNLSTLISAAFSSASAADAAAGAAGSAAAEANSAASKAATAAATAQDVAKTAADRAFAASTSAIEAAAAAKKARTAASSAQAQVLVIQTHLTNIGTLLEAACPVVGPVVQQTS